MTTEWVRQMIGTYNAEEHRLYSEFICAQSCSNIIAQCFKIVVPKRGDLPLGVMLFLTSVHAERLATPSMIVVGSKYQDNLGKVVKPFMLRLHCPEIEALKLLRKQKRFPECDPEE